jgi:rare lipoprotein A (peptidoglycan hydrolase)
MALSCNTEHGTTFFDQCCHPLLAGESLSSLPAQCDPANNEEDLPFCDEVGTDSTTAAAPAATTTPEPKVASTPAAAAPKQAPTTSAKAAPAPSPAAKAAPAPAPKAAPAPAPDSSVNTGGFATFFYQNGVAGACGTVHSDSALIAAIDADRYGNTGEQSSLCGKQVKITNTQNQKSVTVTIADACPTCDNSNSIDLSTGAFQQIATFDQGIVPISWEFV